MGLKEAEYIVEIIKTKKNPLSCIPACSSADCVFSAPVTLYEEGKVNFKNVKFVGLDEWCGCDRYEKTCRWMLDNALFKHIDVKEENMRFFNPNPEDREKECAEMEKFIKDNGGIDCLLLGVGTNGHLALNEPGCDIHIRAHSCSLVEVHKDSIVSDLTVIIMAGLQIQIFVYRFNSNLFMALLMFAFVILDIAKQGICKDGAIICFRGRQFYRWEEADIRVIDSEEPLIIINDSIKFKFNKNKRDRIIKILSENRLYFPASQE